MKRANTNQAARKRNAVLGAVSSTVGKLLFAIVLLWLRGSAGAFISRLLLIMAVGNLLSVPFVWVVLRERLREIEKGEEEDASQY